MSENERIMKLYFDTLSKNFEKLDASVVKIFERMDETNVKLARVETIMEEHASKTTRFQSLQADSEKKLNEVVNGLNVVKSDVCRLKKDWPALREQVQESTAFVKWVKKLPTGVKIVSSLIIAVTSIIGIYEGIGSAIAKLAQ